MESQTKPLAEVVRDLVQQSRILNALDDEISNAIVTIERALRDMRVERIFSVKLPDGADLGWSMNRRNRRWRFVIRLEDDAWELMSCTRDERCEVFTCGAMGKLVSRILEAR